MLEIAKSMLRRPYFIGPFLLFVLIPLHCIPSGLAQAEYEHAFKLFQHGYLARSQEEAQQDSKRFLVSDPELAARFRCLEADAMVWRGMNEDAQRLLSSQPSSIRDPETRIRELTEEAIALTRLQQFPMASQRLIEADMICSVADHTTCGDVLRARGILAVDEEKFNDGRQLFLKSRAFAVAHHDRWLETVALLNLSWTSLQSERFDEAVDWSQSTYRAAIERGEEDLAQRASGDLGWAYFNLGDYERALDLFVEAEKRATELGDVSAQLNWLKTAAYVYREYGKPMEAEATLRQALNISARLNSRTDTVDILEDLSHVAVETGDLAAASAYIDRVAPMARASGSNLDISYVSLAQGKLAAARRQDAQAEALFRAVEHDQASQVGLTLRGIHIRLRF
jgi:tetratricopeptide (TPR) repeat protein